jgi:hypothetical protein
MAERAHAALDDLLDAVREDETAELIADFRARALEEYLD